MRSLVDKALIAIGVGLLVLVVLTIAALFVLPGCSGVSGHLGVEEPKHALGR